MRFHDLSQPCKYIAAMQFCERKFCIVNHIYCLRYIIIERESSPGQLGEMPCTTVKNGSGTFLKYHHSKLKNSISRFTRLIFMIQCICVTLKKFFLCRKQIFKSVKAKLFAFIYMVATGIFIGNYGNWFYWYLIIKKKLRE